MRIKERLECHMVMCWSSSLYLAYFNQLMQWSVCGVSTIPFSIVDDYYLLTVVVADRAEVLCTVHVSISKRVATHGTCSCVHYQ